MSALSIPLTQNQVAIVDEEDFGYLSQFHWYAHWNINTQSFYAGRALPRLYGKTRSVRMHRELLGLVAGDPRQGDHINHNTLDNRRTNLRIVTHSQQVQNRQGQRRCSSGFKGVKKISSGRYQAEIVANGKRMYLGLRDTAELAYRELYEPAALQFHGEYAGGMR